MRPKAASSCDGGGEDKAELGSRDENLWAGTLRADDMDPTSATPGGLGFPLGGLNSLEPMSHTLTQRVASTCILSSRGQSHTMEMMQLGAQGRNVQTDAQSKALPTLQASRDTRHTPALGQNACQTGSSSSQDLTSFSFYRVITGKLKTFWQARSQQEQQLQRQQRRRRWGKWKLFLSRWNAMAGRSCPTERPEERAMRVVSVRKEDPSESKPSETSFSPSAISWPLPPQAPDSRCGQDVVAARSEGSGVARLPWAPCPLPPAQPESRQRILTSSPTTSSEASGGQSDTAPPPKKMMLGDAVSTKQRWRKRQGSEGQLSPTSSTGHPSKQKQTRMADEPAYKPSYMQGGETCVVCDDRATGYHYRAMTCEGCKGFFRRTVQNRMQYVCKEGGQCTITLPHRTACQFCRYQKCLDKGMAMDLVLDETARTRKRQLIQDNRKMRALQAARDATRSRYPAPTPPLTPSQLQFVKSVELAFTASLSESSPAQFTTEERVEGREIETLVTFVRLVLDFFKRLPALGNVTETECLLSQLRPSAVELCVLLVARTRVAPDGSFRTLEGNLTSQQLCARLPQMSSLLDDVLSIHTSLRACNLDDAEFALLLILVLLQTGRCSDADRGSDFGLRQEVGARAEEVLVLLVQYAAFTAPERGNLAKHVIGILLLLRNLSERPTLDVYVALTGQSALTSFTSLFFPPTSYPYRSHPALSIFFSPPPNPSSPP